MAPHTAPSPASVDARPRKATLFCPECGHASPVDGDWAVRTLGNSRRLRCPECQAVVDERRRSRDEAPAVEQCVDAWRRYWSAWARLVADATL
ncbi:hypothetical protein SAMN04488065_1517 [Haloplanus vescus]|uniref:DUF8106 domain-containing protein n=1 Tax=Haloplanus vescus TaxID=555874 RepID=A0A1H3XEJ2_9EURY|nr:hypothetical protein [Haloplanus vescus]SDZ97753.1 hypothetical protein SAMN04488065_1517 [Haloplanus vescus]